MDQPETIILAITGKGGVGKTSIGAAITRLLAERRRGARILAIDADPAMGLSTALGVEVKSTLDDIRRAVVDSAKNGSPKAAVELLNEARFRIFDTMVERQGFAFLAIGRPEAAGCYCTVNAYLKEVISMLAGDFDYVVVDGEAGIEQVNRRVMERVTHLLFVTDQSKKGVQVTHTIKAVADGLVMYDACGVVVNRALAPERVAPADFGGMELLAVIGPDEDHAQNDIRGNSIFELPANAKLLDGVAQALAKLGVLMQ